MEKKNFKKVHFVDIILLSALLLIGGFHEYISCWLSVAMCIYLFLRLQKQGVFIVRKDLFTLAIVAICLGYGLTCFWAVDPGMALIGFLKFLPLLLYMCCLQQESGGSVAYILPYFGAAMAVISSVGMHLPLGETLFSVSGRMAGFFQYPNTFAIFLLVCQLLLLKKSQKRVVDYILLVLLVAGFLYAGSRAALIVAILANTAMVLVLTKKKVRIVSLFVLGGVCLAGLGLAMIPDSFLNRYLSISFTESTFVGRLLYWVDALPLLIKYPFGMGYMGYYYVQQGIQTGVYSVTFAHNDFLQLLLDVGWIPAILFFFALIQWFCKKTVPAADKIIGGALCLHSLFDFNLQFIGVFFLLLWIVYQNNGAKTMVCKVRLPLKFGCALVLLVSLYMSVPLCAAHWGARNLADTLYPYNTQNKLEMLERENNLQEAYDISQQILAQNTDFYAPYTVMARYYYSKGDFGAMIQNAQAALERNPFLHTEYEVYCRMLITGIDLYEKAGDRYSADVCRQVLIDMQRQLMNNADRLSYLGKQINDQPVTALPADIQEYIAGIQGE